MKKARILITCILITCILITFILAPNSWLGDQSDIRNHEPYRIELFYESRSAFGNVQAPYDFNWREFDGMVLNFLIGNNINANILSREVDKFTAVTGITVNFVSMGFDALTEQINMEFITQGQRFDLIYVDPYQTLVRFPDSLENLYRFEDDESLPGIVGGMESFLPEHTAIVSYFQDTDELLAIPFDSTTMILFYRQDIFEKYRNDMERDLGFYPVPGSSNFTWERFLEVSQWINENVPEDEIKYSSITMSAHHNSIYVEFSNILSAFGGNYFSDEEVSSLGIPTGTVLNSNTPEFLEALRMYQDLASVSAYSNKLTWDESAELFKNGAVAMMVNWDEKAPMLEYNDHSLVAGNVGYRTLPFGPAQSANIFGGSGVGINTHISEERKLAAWLFIVWATSPQVQIITFLEEHGGNMPTRTNLRYLISAKYIASLPQASATTRAQTRSFSYFRPKMETGHLFEQMIIENLVKMIHNDTTPEETAANMAKEWDTIRESWKRDQNAE